MADATRTKPGLPPAGALRVERTSRSGRRAALRLMLTGRSEGDDAAVDRFLDFASANGFDLEQVYTGHDGGRLTAVAMLVPSPGRTAMLFLSSARTQADQDALGHTVHAVCRQQDRQAIHLIQTLLEPSQEVERRALRSAGFAELAELLYMSCPIGKSGAPFAPDPSIEPIEVVTWRPRHHELFARATLATYEQTLDCPGLRGLRHIDDILEGHKASGRFEPPLWMALRCGDDPVGVMLLNVVPQRSALELVYLGLSPHWRGHRLGGKLVRHAQWLARKRRVAQIVLAVDSVNSPALALYRAAGFTQSSRKIAMIYATGATGP